MKFNKPIPWNWLKKEQEQEGNSLPVSRKNSTPASAYPLASIHREIDNQPLTSSLSSFPSAPRAQ